MEEKKNRTFSLPARTIELIKAISGREGIPQSDVIIRSVDLYDGKKDPLAEMLSLTASEIKGFVQSQADSICARLGGKNEMNNRDGETIQKQ